MPLDLVYVEHVGSVGTVNPAVTQHLVTGTTVEDHPRRLQMMTVNNLKAAACLRARAIGRHVWIGWKDSRYGPEIVTVQIDDTKFDPTNPPAEKVIR